MSLKDELSIFDPAAEVQKAYDGARSNEFDGAALEPWTIARESAAMMLGVRILQDWSVVRKFAKDGRYSNEIHDFTVVLWLCHRSKEEVFKLIRMTEDQKLEQVEIAYNWASEISLEPGSKSYNEAGRLIGKIIGERIKSHFVTEGSGASDKKKATRQHGK